MKITGLITLYRLSLSGPAYAEHEIPKPLNGNKAVEGIYHYMQA